jgi:hypothetical protein
LLQEAKLGSEGGNCICAHKYLDYVIRVGLETNVEISRNDTTILRSVVQIKVCIQVPITYHVKNVNLSCYRHARDKGGRSDSYSFLTSALDGGEWSASLPGRALTPAKKSSVPIGYEAGWASELIWAQMLEEKSFASAGDRTPVAQSVVRPYID